MLDNFIKKMDNIKKKENNKNNIKQIIKEVDNLNFNKHIFYDPNTCDNGFVKFNSNYLNKKKIDINLNISSLNDLCILLENYPLNYNIEYNLDISKFHIIKSELNQLNNFIGLEELKENILDQIIYFTNNEIDDYLHTVLYGPPGTGKTEIAKIIGQIFKKIGILKKGTFVKVTRNDLVAGYLGQTAIKTRKLVEENLGGVIFIDEAYSMGSNEKQDMFSKEALDTLCELLSDNKKNLMVIIAGYEKELESCFFSYNKGLDSRFPWKLELKKYDSLELSKIFKKKINDAGWNIIDGIADEKWFEENKDSFNNYGRDIENLFSRIKIKFFRRRFGKENKDKIINNEDLIEGFKTLKKEIKKECIPSFMYS